MKLWLSGLGSCRLALPCGPMLQILAAGPSTCDLCSESCSPCPSQGGEGGTRFCILCPGKVFGKILECFLWPAENTGRCKSLATLRRPAGSLERYRSAQGRYPGSGHSYLASNKTFQGSQIDTFLTRVTQSRPEAPQDAKMMAKGAQMTAN